MMNYLSGHSLGRYHILEKLGEGGMAVVYKAFDTHLECEVAVKVIRLDNLPRNAEERALKRFEREARSVAKLDHPNIVKVTDYGEHEGSPYLVMPYLPGGTLKQNLKEHGRMVWQDAARLLTPVAEALEYAHRKGIVHRDVKPSNILLTADKRPMLTDFGVAKVVDGEVTQDLTGTSATVGTPEYMAPEQVMSKTVDHRADIYALGVVFFEMITGRRPYEADTPMAVLVMHSRDPLPRPKDLVPELPDAVEQVLLKALAKGPEYRYADMAAFAAALERLERNQQLTAPAVEKTKTVIEPIATTYATFDQIERDTALPQTPPRVATESSVEIKPDSFFDFGNHDIKGLSETVIPEKEIDETETNCENTEPELVTPVSATAPLPRPEKARYVSPYSQPGGYNKPDIIRWKWLVLTLIVIGGIIGLFVSAVNRPNQRAVVVYPTSTPEIGATKTAYAIVAGTQNARIRITQTAVEKAYTTALAKITSTTTVKSQKYEMLLKVTLNKDILTIAKSPTESLIAVGTSAGIYLMDATSLVEKLFINTESYLYNVAFSPDGQILASIENDNSDIYLWRVSDGKKVSTFVGHSDYIIDIEFSPTGDLLASASADGTIRIWKVSTGLTMHTLQGDEDRVRSISFSPNGQTLASGGDDSNIRLWNVDDGTLINALEGHADWVNHVVFSPDGQLLASGGRDSKIIIWGVSDGALLRTMEGYNYVECNVFSPDGTILVSGSASTPDIHVWRVSDGKLLDTLKGNVSGIPGVIFSHDGSNLISVSYEGAIMLWGDS